MSAQGIAITHQCTSAMILPFTWRVHDVRKGTSAKGRACARNFLGLFTVYPPYYEPPGRAADLRKPFDVRLFRQPLGERRRTAAGTRKTHRVRKVSGLIISREESGDH